MNKILYFILNSHLWTSDNFSDLRIRLDITLLFYFLIPMGTHTVLNFQYCKHKNNGVQPNVKPVYYLKQAGYRILDK